MPPLAKIRVENGENGGSAGPRRELRLRMGAIQEAVLAVLGEASNPLRPCDIHALVEQRLARRVSDDTVSSYLSVAARDKRSIVRRIQPATHTVEPS
jgi:hypothetical protein